MRNTLLLLGAMLTATCGLFVHLTLVEARSATHCSCAAGAECTCQPGQCRCAGCACGRCPSK